MSQIVIVGEAWGAEEEREGRPFVGASGHLLRQCLSMVGIPYNECYVTNVFNLRPRPSNDVSNLCGPKEGGIPGMPSVQSGKYVRAEFNSELLRLYGELERERPNVVIALGGTAAWALCHTSGIKKIRGAPLLGRNGLKVLPTYHPAAVLRDYSLRPILIADLDKAKREAQFPEVRRPERKIWIEPTIEDLLNFETVHLMSAQRCAVDIETVGDQITCIGFAPNPDIALVVPFFLPPNKNYWPTSELENEVWNWVRHVLALPIQFVFQNGMYDITFLWRRYGITVPGAAHDTMLLHHALQPEMEKGLGFLGSIYTDEAAWKFMRPKHETIKRED